MATRWARAMLSSRKCEMMTEKRKTETIRATDGAGTGMKWLADRKDCLVVTVGSEGFCR